MVAVENKDVLVLGLGASGSAATGLLRGRGAAVVAIDSADTESLRREAEELRKLGAAANKERVRLCRTLL